MVVERARALPILIVMTHRPQFSPPWSGQAHVTALPLNRLGRRQGAAMALQVTGGKALPAEILDQILERTDGVPLFVEELTRTMLESGLMTDAGDRYELTGPLPPLAIPANLHNSLMARLDRLAPVKELAQIGAVIGREFSHELIAAVADRPQEQLGKRARPAGRLRARVSPRQPAGRRPTVSSTPWSRTPPISRCSSRGASSCTLASRTCLRTGFRLSSKPNPSCSHIT